MSITPASGENFSLTLAGAGAGTTMLDGGSTTRVLNIMTSGISDDSNADITIMNLTIQNGKTNTNNDGGGLFVLTNSANVIIHNCEFFNNSAIADPARGNGSSGGGLYVSGGGNTTIKNSEFNNNSASAVGIEDGIALGGGAALFVAGDVKLLGNTFNSNIGEGEDAVLGGGLEVQIGGELILRRNIFTENFANVKAKEFGEQAVGQELIL